MKKTLITFCVILAGIYLVLTILDTSDYALEKRLWRVQRKYDRIAKDPKVVPEQEFDILAQRYKALIKKYPKSNLVPRIYLQIGMTYGMKKDYPKARDTFNKIIAMYPNNTTLGAVALLNIGNSYEEENNERDAIATYRRILNNYPFTDIGMNMPLYIANYYKKIDKVDEYIEALQGAVKFYKEQSDEYPDTAIEFNALRLLVTTFYAQKDWGAAVDSLGDTLLTYSKSKYLNAQRANLLVRSINTVSVTQLQDYDKPMAIYKQFIDENPGHPLNPLLEKMIDALQKLVNEKIKVSVE